MNRHLFLKIFPYLLLANRKSLVYNVYSLYIPIGLCLFLLSKYGRFSSLFSRHARNNEQISSLHTVARKHISIDTHVVIEMKKTESQIAPYSLYRAPLLTNCTPVLFEMQPLEKREFGFHQLSPPIFSSMDEMRELYSTMKNKHNMNTIFIHYKECSELYFKE